MADTADVGPWERNRGRFPIVQHAEYGVRHVFHHRCRRRERRAPHGPLLRRRDRPASAVRASAALVAVAVTCCGFLGAGASAVAHTAQYGVQHSLTVKQDTAGTTFSGKLSSLLAACASGREVALYRVDASGTATLAARPMTDGQGLWSRLVADAGRGYHAEASKKVLTSPGHAHTCLAATSNAISVVPDQDRDGSADEATTVRPSPTPIRRTPTMTGRRRLRRGPRRRRRGQRHRQLPERRQPGPEGLRRGRQGQRLRSGRPDPLDDVRPRGDVAAPPTSPARCARTRSWTRRR